MRISDWSSDVCSSDLRELLGDEVVEQRDVLEPAAVIMLEQVAQHDAARLLIGLEADELHPLVGGAHGALGQQPPDLIGLLAVGSSEPFPDLLLTRIDRKSTRLNSSH